MRLFRFYKNIGYIMIINSVIGKVDGLEIDLKLSDGVNFIFYTDKSERLLYEKIFRLAFDEYYYADDFYENHDIELEFNMKCSIDCKLHYKTYTISDVGTHLDEEFEIAGMRLNANRSELKLAADLTNGLLKKRGYKRFFNCYDILPTEDDDIEHILKEAYSQEEFFNTSLIAKLYGYIRGLSPKFVDAEKTCKLYILANGKFYLEGFNDDDEMFCLSEYFKFITAEKVADRYAHLIKDADRFPLFICGLLENAGKKADINAILSELEDYRWQTIFLCPEEDKNKIEGSNHNYLLN